MPEYSAPSQEPSLTPLQRRSIEIDVAQAFHSALTSELGEEAASALFRQAVTLLADSSADTFRAHYPEPTLESLWEVWQVLGGEGRLDLELDELSAHRLRFHVTRCSYAEMYQSRGLEVVGAAFSCDRDAPFARALVPGVSVTQSKTILQGSPRCEFEYTLEDK